MKVTVVEFYSRRTKATKKVTGKLKPPTIIARNWYALNNNKNLMYTLQLSGRLTDFNGFDSVKIGTETFFIFSRASKGEHMALFEIGS